MTKRLIDNYGLTKNSVKNTVIGQRMLDGTLGVKNASLMSALIRVASRPEWLPFYNACLEDANKNGRYNANVTEEMKEDIAKYNKSESDIKAVIYQAKKELKKLKDIA